MSDNYKDTLNLPFTDFPMKANLPTLEPIILKKWQDLNLYQEIQQETKNKKSFILHDGPPYANGNIHIGHALNIVLKDIVVKSKLLSGFHSPFVPGWDCHGLPIELNVEKKVGKPGDKIDAKTFREKCREYADSQIDLQRRDFVRLGVLGDWEHPYLTMDPHYEANIIRSLAKIIENGHVIKGFKPVHWCIDCGSALAEAEVEYRNKVSNAIDVCFQVVDNQQLPKEFQGAIQNSTTTSKTSSNDNNIPICVVIWTTTPWTLPANEAVAVHPTHRYALVHFEELSGGLNEEANSNEKTNKRESLERLIIVVSELVSSVMQRYGVEKYQVLAECEGSELEHLLLKHPFYDKQVPVLLGEHVTLDAGTGCVHTAPAHGQEDYQVAIKYHLPIENPVGANGCFVPGTPLLAGEHVNKVNEKIINLIKEKHKLLHFAKIEHSYPHCWRHKTPLIFRATQQWFISMEQKHLRESALEAIKKVFWIPSWGQGRIESMIDGRPDWCISRQRTWGVPLCLFTDKKTGDLHPKTVEIMEKVAKKVESRGVDAWFDEPASTYLPPGDENQYEKSMDTLDVWFDSGVSHYCVLKQWPNLSFPADLYLEGSDQHRGWFQSSLLSSIAMNNQAPYRQVLTHGFMVDMDGHKMSKSLGNVLAPEKIINSLGADILRLWVSTTDYRSEIAVAEEILKRSSDSYRRIRNTARFLLANLNGFDPEQHLVSVDNLIKLDRWIINHAQQLQKEIEEAYQDYQFHMVYQKIHHFCSIDLGSFYLDVIKDRQYTGKTNGIPRRSAQTALYHIAEALVRWMAPIMSFTAEEIWQYLPGSHPKSIFLTEWYRQFPEMLKDLGDFTNEFWQMILELREAVNKALEEARVAGLIGSGLEARVSLYCDPEIYHQLAKLQDELRFILITSSAKIYPLNEKPQDAKQTSFPNLWVWVVPANQPKCVRCWHRREDVDQNKQYPGLCARCVENIAGEGEQRYFA